MTIFWEHSLKQLHSTLFFLEDSYVYLWKKLHFNFSQKFQVPFNIVGNMFFTSFLNFSSFNVVVITFHLLFRFIKVFLILYKNIFSNFHLFVSTTSLEIIFGNFSFVVTITVLAARSTYTVVSFLFCVLFYVQLSFLPSKGRLCL